MTEEKSKTTFADGAGPEQTHGNDCGIFMIMYAWYFAMEARFDFNIYDMSSLRRWWCIVLVENLGLQGYGRKFAHFTKEGRATVQENPPPVMRISRKRRHSSSTVVPADTADHPYSKMPCIFPTKDLGSDVSMDKQVASGDNTPASLVERAQKAKQQRRESSCLLINTITKDQGMLQHLQNVIKGNVVSPWAKKQDRVFILFEGDDQVDQVMSFLSGVLESTQTEEKYSDPVAFIMDVLLPEATIYALAAVYSISLDEATDRYKCGTQFDSSEMILLGEELQSHISDEARLKLESLVGKFQQALDSEDFVRRL